ncbi:hypothetical protein FACS1894188_08740 [Clostridia bacterium]|nr:hypothetical protein FACS1894188_08740 [Clostridia bacterium]
MSIIDRNGAETLIKEEWAAEIIDGLTNAAARGGSVVLKLAKRVPDMKGTRKIVPVFSRLPSAPSAEEEDKERAFRCAVRFSDGSAKFAYAKMSSGGIRKVWIKA